MATRVATADTAARPLIQPAPPAATAATAARARAADSSPPAPPSPSRNRLSTATTPSAARADTAATADRPATPPAAPAGVGADAGDGGNGGDGAGGGIYLKHGALTLYSDTIAFNKVRKSTPGEGGKFGSGFGLGMSGSPGSVQPGVGGGVYNPIISL